MANQSDRKTLMSFIRTNRKIHKWGSIIAALPLLVVIISGILLLVRKEFAYLQPETKVGLEKIPSISFEQIITQVKTVTQANVNSWQDIDRLDVRPNTGVIKVRTNSQWEIQLDSNTADILQVAYRRSDFIESLHDGTYFQDNANLWLMLPSALILLTLLITGLFLFFYPYYKRR
ncbi:PepSY domain-containing protein [Thalassotalea castellviae]|uniref:PepSY domain-containing protein n=1 Tax=Thalassotalea castellviae TaxID=3075612 RepID=A0ABU3A1N4_9GAMM|nr:PepSY domain-containing protein [Thalassotalea sp. W431]MDT0603855.1 PepSY domain-containing protein [Thalassotalea sp. W431]